MDEQTVVAGLVKLIQEAEMPKWWTSYASQIAYNLQVHTKGLMFDKIIGLFPNEHPDSQKHCINSYESITKGSIWKSLNNVIRIFNNSSYNIQISDNTTKLINDYQNSEGSLFSQFLEDWIKSALATDPNGLCVVYPPSYTSDLYRFISFKDLKHISEETLVFKSEAESVIKTEFIDQEYSKEIFFDHEYLDGGPNVRHTTVRTFNRRLEHKYLKTVYHVFTKTHFWRFYKEKEEDTEFIYEYFQHPKPFVTLPYFNNGGVEFEKGLYESFVQSFVPFGNLALMSHRNHRAVDLMFSYPRMSEVQQECDACDKDGKVKVTTKTGTISYESCRVCKGSGYVTPQSPYKVYRKIKDSFDADGKIFSTPSVEFYSPDAAILDYSKKEWKDYLRQAETAVFVQQKIETGNVQAAESKQIDREELYSWLANISKVLFGNLEMLLQYFENYVNQSPIRVSIERPYSFAILTESEAFDALSTMLASSAPISVKANQIENFINKFISESSPVKRALQILKKFDLLWCYSDDNVQSLKGQGVISNKLVIQHTLAYPVLIQMYELDKSLFDLEDENIIQKLMVEIDKYDLTKDLKASLLTPLKVTA